MWAFYLFIKIYLLVGFLYAMYILIFSYNPPKMFFYNMLLGPAYLPWVIYMAIKRKRIPIGR